MTVQDRAGHCMLWKQLPAAEEVLSKQQRTSLSQQAEWPEVSCSQRWILNEGLLCQRGSCPAAAPATWEGFLAVVCSNFLWRKSKRSVFTETGSKARDRDRQVGEKSLLAGLGTGTPFCCGDTLLSSSTDPPWPGGGQGARLALGGCLGEPGWQIQGSQGPGDRCEELRSNVCHCPNGTEHPSSEPQCDPTLLPHL